jgi:hypothetical protein
LDETEMKESRARVSSAPVSDNPVKPQPVMNTSGCPDGPRPDAGRSIHLKGAVIRPFRNMTPYSVALTVGKEPLTILSPCFTRMVTIPAGEFTIRATAMVPAQGRQSAVVLETVANAAGTGWDIIRAEPDGDPQAIATQVQQQR